MEGKKRMERGRKRRRISCAKFLAPSLYNASMRSIRVYSCPAKHNVGTFERTIFHAARQAGLSLTFVICDIRALWRSGLSVRVPGCQKLYHDLTRSGTGCFILLYPYCNSGRQRVNRNNSTRPYRTVCLSNICVRSLSLSKCRMF